MFELTCALILMIALSGAAYAYTSVRDPLHPAVFLAPLFAYFYGLWPILLNQNNTLSSLFPGGEAEHASLVFLLSIAAMYIGLLHGTARLQQLPPASLNPFGDRLSPAVSRRLRNLALLMGGLSVAAYIMQLEAVGGLLQAYSRGKGGGRADSGYIGEAILLSFPALLVLALSVYAAGRRIRIQDILLALCIASPHLIQGVLGGRRGPLFLILSTLLFSWLIASGKRVKLVTILIAVAVIAFAAILVSSQRKYLYLGTDQSFELSRIYEADGIATQDTDATNSYVAAVATIGAFDYYQDYYWGYRYLVTFFVRPIPKQIWPTKYEDMGATWLTMFDDSPENTRFLYAVGIAIPAGAAAGSIADGYGEFYWGVVLMFFLLGRAFSATYMLHRRAGGFWTVCLMMMLALSIYLPSQSFSAWLHRLLFMSVFAYLFWRMTMGPILSRGPQTSAPVGLGQFRRY